MKLPLSRRMGSRLKKKKKTFGHELLQVGYWEQLVGHIVIFTASLVNQILQDKLREYKAFSSSPYVVGLKSIVKADKIQSSTQRLCIFSCHPQFIVVSTRWLSCWWCWSAWEGPWWMIGPGRACNTWSTSNKVLGTCSTWYLVFGVSSTSLLYIKQAVRSNWYLVSEVLGLNQAMWGHTHACASFVMNHCCFYSFELSLALSVAL